MYMYIPVPVHVVRLQITSSKTNDRVFHSFVSVFLGIGGTCTCTFTVHYHSHVHAYVYVYMYSLTCVIIQLGYMCILGSN